MASYIARRKFLATLGGAAAAWPLAARAQQGERVRRIGYLGFGPASAWSTRVEALRAGLRDLGWVEGKNIVIEFRWADRVDEAGEADWCCVESHDALACSSPARNRGRQ